MKVLLSLILLLGLVGCQSVTEKTLQYKKVTFEELPGWQTDRLREALPALRSSCGATKQNTLPSFCRVLNELKDPTEQDLRLLIQNHFTPYHVSFDNTPYGKMTGYYEPLLRGSKRSYGPYRTPLYAYPVNSKSVNVNVPRAAIVAGALARQGLELVWVDDPVDAFFLQIQGSGRVQLEDGTIMRLGFAGTNNHPYFPIGKELVDRKALAIDKVSLQSIKKWLKEHPWEAESVMSLNQSYVFFRELKEDGPIGSQGVPLTPQRSAAVDVRYIALGTLLWVDVDHPTASEKIQRMLVAQDTGGAIKGGLRLDYFWGFGKDAEENAGVMNKEGALYILLPDGKGA